MIDQLTSTKKCHNCGNDIWDIWGDVLQCSNCWVKRPYHKRERGTDITPSQQKSVDKIRALFDGSRFSDDRKPTKELHKFEVKMQAETGFCYVSVDTHENILISEGGHFVIGRRGGIKVLSDFHLGDHDFWKKHYAKMLGGKVGW